MLNLKTEAQLQSKLIKYLNDKGYYVVKVIKATKAGVPDILTCISGMFVGIECKTEKGKVTELQLYNLNKIVKSGGVSIVYRGEPLEEFHTRLLNIIKVKGELYSI